MVKQHKNAATPHTKNQMLIKQQKQWKLEWHSNTVHLIPTLFVEESAHSVSPSWKPFSNIFLNKEMDNKFGWSPT